MKKFALLSTLLLGPTLILASECKIHSNGGGKICGIAKVESSVRVDERSIVSGNVEISGNVILENANISGTDQSKKPSRLFDRVKVKNASIAGSFNIYDDVKILGSKDKNSITLLGDTAKIKMNNNVVVKGDEILIKGDHFINGNVKIGHGTSIQGKTNMWGNVQISRAKLAGKGVYSGNTQIVGKCSSGKNCINIVGNKNGVSFYGNAKVFDEVKILGEVVFTGKASAHGNAVFMDRTQVYAGTFRDKVLLKDDAYVWGNKTLLSGSTKVTGRYKIFNYLAKDEDFSQRVSTTKPHNFQPHIFSKLNDKVIEDLVTSLTEGKAVNSNLNLKYSIDGKKLRPITKEQAREYINTLKALFGERLKKANDGCYPRAHVASIEADKLGIDTSKIVIVTPHSLNKNKGVFTDLAKRSRLLRFETNSGNAFEWKSHISNLIYIKDANGKAIPFVIDPAMSNEPISISDWVKDVTKTKPEEKKLAYVSFVVMPKQVNGFKSLNRTEADYQAIYNRPGKTKDLINLIDEIAHETSVMDDNFK